MIETQTIDKAPQSRPKPAHRYQLGNHLGSASLELDEAGGLISYEEYSPYGNTTYQAGRSAAEVSLKRYRYTAKERDEENGFTYHGARYYAPWLGRWTAADPIGLRDGINLYVYVGGQPITTVDRTGNDQVKIVNQSDPLGGASAPGGAPQPPNFVAPSAPSTPVTPPSATGIPTTAQPTEVPQTKSIAPEPQTSVGEEKHGKFWWWLHSLGLTQTKHENAEILRRGWGCKAGSLHR